MEIYIVVNLFEERVVELKAEVGRPGERLDRETREHALAEEGVLADTPEDHKAEEVGAERLQQRQVAQRQHEALRASTGHPCEGQRPVLQCRCDNLHIGGQPKSYTWEEHQASLNHLVLPARSRVSTEKRGVSA